MACVLPRFSISLLLALAVPPVFAQQPPVKLNVLNVCSPSAEEQKEISSALARGRSSLSETPGFLQAGQSAQLSGDPVVSNWVRMRREFSSPSSFSTVQYSFIHAGKNMVETLVLHLRDPKDLSLISIEDSASAVTSAAAMLAAATPATRIKLERLGKSSVVLARCSGSDGGPAPDQSAYEPLFATASALMTGYRSLLNARRTVPEELAKLTSAGASTAGKARTGSRGAAVRPSRPAPKPN